MPKKYTKERIKVPRFNEESGFYTTPERSKIMGKIRGKNTKPELAFRKALWQSGYRYRIDYKKLIGKPDIALKKYKTVLYFHGNAGSLENRIHKLNHFHKMDVNFLIIAWRGFSGNKGKPSEKGLYKDGRGGINWLIKKGVKEENIVIYGESLGTGVATHLSQNKNFAGVVLETPFTSMIDAAKTFYPYIPVSLLLKDKFDNKSKIANIKTPILIMHGEADQIVPFSMGKKMYEKANEPKYSYFTKHDNHMMEYDENLVKALNNFLKSLN